MFDDVGIDVRNLEKSKTFYSNSLAPLGIKLILELKDSGAAGFGKDRPRFWIGAGTPSNGENDFHICFSAESRAEVRAFYEAAIAAGARDNGKPGLRPKYHENYYGAFVFDLDGNNIEACCHLADNRESHL
jgi:catechol 2,3-dioxygenase-like lactoylglutathione lyase family enzyme